jgi:hypothetical protein
VINDGEASKPSYATYVTERLDGFGGGSGPPPGRPGRWRGCHIPPGRYVK